MALKRSMRLSISSQILQRRLFLLWLQSKCSVPRASSSRIHLKGALLLMYCTKLSLHLFLQQTFPRAGRVHALFAESLCFRDFGHMAFIDSVRSHENRLKPQLKPLTSPARS